MPTCAPVATERELPPAPRREQLPSAPVPMALLLLWTPPVGAGVVLLLALALALLLALLLALAPALEIPSLVRVWCERCVRTALGSACWLPPCVLE